MSEPRTDAGKSLLADMLAVRQRERFPDKGGFRRSFSAAILAIEAEAAVPVPALDGLREALDPIMKEHRRCGPKYEACYSHFAFMAHCRADGMAWPCDVEAIRLRVGMEYQVTAARVVTGGLPDPMDDRTEADHE